MEEVKNSTASFSLNDDEHSGKVKVYEGVSAGFPSPAEEYAHMAINLNELMGISRPSVFLVKCVGDSMIGAGIFNGSILVVDKSLPLVHNKVIIAYMNSEFTVKRYIKNSEGEFLFPENSKFEPIPIKNFDEMFHWGTVTYVVNNML